MKKLVYVAVVAFLFVGGLAAGVIHKGMQSKTPAGGPIVSGVAVDPAGGTIAGAETPGLSLADLSASTPTDGMSTETLSLGGDPAAMATATPETIAAVDDANRSFGGGGSSGASSSGGSGGFSGGGSSGGSSMSTFSDSSSSTWSDSSAMAAATPRARRGKDPVDPAYQGSIASNSTTVTSESSIIEDAPPTPRKGKGKSSSAAVVAPPPESIDELPTVDTGFSDADLDSAPEAVSQPAVEFVAPAATPPPMVASNFSSGGGDLTFGAASKSPALLGVTQKQNGTKSVVTVKLKGNPRYKIIQIPKKRQVWIDFEETEVPGGGGSTGGSANHVREVSAKFFGNAGGTSIARVIVTLDDGVVQMNDRGKEELNVSPNRGTGEVSNGVFELTIGAKQGSF